MTRAMASVPTVRLPMENPPEGYWEECDLGVCDKKKVLNSNLQQLEGEKMEKDREREGERERERDRERERRRERERQRKRERERQIEREREREIDRKRERYRECV